MDGILIGRIVNTVGLKGEVKVLSYAESNSRFQSLPCIFTKDKEFEINDCRFHKANVILKLKGIDNLKDAESLKGEDIYFKEEFLEELPQDNYYVRDLIGLKVVFKDGSEAGIIKDVLKGGAQDLLEIEMREKTVLLPFVGEFVPRVDMEKKQIIIDPPPGLLEL